MAIDRLDAPIRLTWTLQSGVLAPSDLEVLARRIGEAGVFFVTLRGDFHRDPVTPAVVEVLRSFGLAPVLIVPGGAAGDACLPQGVSVHLDLTAQLLEGRHAPDGVGRFCRTTPCSALSLVPLRPLLRQVPGILALAGQLGVAVHLPNVPLVDDVDGLAPLVPRASDLAVLAEALQNVDRSVWPDQIVAHDLFVWELLFPGRDREHYLGCQAGNSLAHLACDGTLHPCISWPLPLGSLFDSDLPTLWSGAGRRAVLQSLAQTPDGCHSCRMLPRCHGGCRGLVQTLAGENQAPDLLCAGPVPDGNTS